MRVITGFSESYTFSRRLDGPSVELSHYCHLECREGSGKLVIIIQCRLSLGQKTSLVYFDCRFPCLRGIQQRHVVIH